MKELSFIVAFVIGTLALQMMMGDGVTQNFLILVLISMVLLNVDKFSTLLGRLNGQ